MNKKIFSLTCAISCSFIWGTAFVAQDMGMDHIGPFTFTMARLFLGFLTLLPFMLLKALVFGLLIAIIACGWGLTTRGGPKEVGSSTTGAVVMTLITVSLVDVLLTQVLFG